jgi:hypothetical protein
LRPAGDDGSSSGDDGSSRGCPSAAGTHGASAGTLRAVSNPRRDTRDGKLVQLWPVQESLPLLEGVGAVVRVKGEG